ncbi:MAG: hypothetical protein J7559_21020 [Cohnella sp.]|nr:hypothetical protein [Cohnella sp.]
MTDRNQNDDFMENDSFEAQVAELAAQSSLESKRNSDNPFLYPPINPHPRSDLE